MQTIVQRRSPGASIVRGGLFGLALALPHAAFAQDYATGQAAYAQRDWAAAAVLWQVEADAGSAEALLGLGNIYDFGLLGESDPELAFDFYRQAADGGLAEAAFNVAVMHDSGVGIPRDVQAATAWYSFAALGGNARAAYNLGQLFTGGVDVPRNDALARFWLERAALAIPSARTALADLPPFGLQVETPATPNPLAMRIFTPPTGPKARMAWVNGTSPPDARYRVELIRFGPDGSSLFATAETIGSAVSVDLPSAEDDIAWRVTQIAGAAYAASDWQTADGAPLAEQPIGTVRFEFSATDRRAEGLAFRMGGAMARFGAIVDYAPFDGAVVPGAVTYGYSQDEGFAEDVSAFLPGDGRGASVLLSGAGTVPGEVQVTLGFGE